MRRGYELPRVAAKRVRPVRGIKNSGDEGLARRTKIVKTSRIGEGSRMQSRKECLRRGGSRKESKIREEIEACKEIKNSGEEIKDSELPFRLVHYSYIETI